jgi:hypothetical protein
MRKHLSVTAILAAVLGLSTFAAGQQQLDIALEGPWILLTDKMDGNNILIAVAPVDATDTDPIDEEGHFHHPPQLSSGNGFYLPTPSASSPGIFCLAFDRCAPKAGSTFTYDPSYPPEQILTLTGNNANKQWRSYGANNDVVILPMPNFYHADGIWAFQFHDANHKVAVSYGPYTYTIGLTLHYSSVPVSKLKLFSCPTTVSSVTDCKNQTQDDQGNLIVVTNTGTIRLQMRAPDTTDDCDHHVRYGFHQMLKLLDPNYANYKNYRYIEPAQGMDPTDNGIFETSAKDHPCFDNDSDDQDDNTFTAAFHHAVAAQANPANGTNPFTNALDKVDAQWPAKDPKLDDKQEFRAARNTFKQALAFKGSLRISDVTRMGALAALSANQIGVLIAELQLQSAQSKERDAQIDEICKLEKLKKALNAFADGTKNGADCRAAQVLVQ